VGAPRILHARHGILTLALKVPGVGFPVDEDPVRSRCCTHRTAPTACLLQVTLCPAGTWTWTAPAWQVIWA